MSDLILYHGTIAEFSVIDLKYCKDKKDFGRGFYTTTSINQAVDLARAMKRRQIFSGNAYAKAYVYSFKIDKQLLKMLHTHTFQSANISWVDYVIKNRYSTPHNSGGAVDFDVVIGKVADANTNRLINEFREAYGDKATNEQKEQLIKRLRPENLTDQYCFKSNRSLKLLNACMQRREIR